MSFGKRTIFLLLMLAVALTTPTISASLLVNVGAVACTRELVSMRLNSASLFENTLPVPDSNHCLSSLPFFQQAAAWDSHNVQAQGWLGMVNLLQRKYVEAYTDLLSGLGMGPNNSVAGFRIGVALYKLGRTEDAIAQWRELRVEGFFIGAGDTARKHGEFAQAEQYHRLAMSIAPDSPEAHLELAEDLYTLGEFDEALIYYGLGFTKLGRSSSVNVGEASYHQALILIGHGQYAEAILALERANEHHPGYPIYIGALGEVYGRLGNYEKAEYWLNETVRIVPASDFAYYNYGNYYMRRQMFAQAVAQYERAVQVNPGGPAYLYGSIGSAYFALGKYDLAVQAFREALRRDPGNTTYVGSLNTALTAKGQGK